MDFDNFQASENNQYYQNAPFHLGAEVTSYPGSDGVIGSPIPPSSPVLSTCSGSVYSSASLKQTHTTQKNGIPSDLHHVGSTRSSRKVRHQVQTQATYLETTVGKLRTELARVRDSTSIIDLSNSRLSLSSIERDLSTKFELPNPKYRHVSRHFTQLQGVYGKAFSDISKAVSGEAGPRSNLNSIQLTLESSIDPIAEEYENFIFSLESQLNNIAATPTKRSTKTDVTPVKLNVTSLTGSHFYPSANRKEVSHPVEERLINNSPIRSSKPAVKPGQCTSSLLQGGKAEVAEGKGKEERYRELATLEQSETGEFKMLADANATHLKSTRKDQTDGRLLSDFQELQVRHATTVDELEQIRTQYLNTLKELDELTAQQEEARRRERSSSILRRPILANSTNSFSTLSATVPSSPASSTLRKFPVYSTSSLLSRRSCKPHCSESPKEGHAHKEELLETINVNDHAEQPRLQEEGYRSTIQLSSEGSLILSMPNRKSARAPLMGPMKRTYSNSGSPCLQPLNLPLIRSSSLSLSQYSVLRGHMKSPNSSATSCSVTEFSSPLMLDLSNDQQVHHNPERSHESLEKEVIQLQEVLKEREQEIRELESTVRQVTCLSESGASLRSDYNDDQSSMNGYTRVSISQFPQNCNIPGPQSIASSGSRVQDNKDDNHLLPAVSCIVEFSQKRFSDDNRNELAITDNIKSLNVLMRSMAKKEAGFVQTIHNLQSQLKTTERNHQDLVKLSADQVVNMSSEIEALNEKLKMSQILNPEDGREELREQALHGEQLRQAEIQALKDDQKSELEKLKMERSENFDQLFALTNDKLIAKEEEFRQLEARWQTSLKAELTAQADMIWAESDTQQSNLVRAQLKSFQAKSSRERENFNREIEKLNKKHERENERIREEMTAKLKSAETHFTNRIQEFDQLHARKVAQIASSVPHDTRKMTDSSDGASQAQLDEFEPWHVERNQLVSRNYELENEKLYLISEHELRQEKLKAEHARVISELQADHEDTLIAALSELDQRRTIKFRAQLKMTEEAHVLQVNEIKRIYEQKIALLTSSKDKKHVYQSQDPSKQSYPARLQSVESLDNYSGSDSSTTSVGENGTIDTAVLDPRMLKKIEDQDSAISKLTKQLAQCEGNLQANISAIAQLEDALNDTERNLRKSRLQMNGLVQERDKMSIVNQRLRMELLGSQSEIEQIKQGLQQEKLQLEGKLQEEKLAKEAAKNQLETRMLELEKNQGKRSKFNCF